MNIFKTVTLTALFSLAVLFPSFAVLQAADSGKMDMTKHEKAGTNISHMKMDVKAASNTPMKQTLKGQQAKIGDSVVCPVLGTKFTVTDKSLFVKYKGKKYYVCCSGCIDPLKKNPKKYLK